MSAHAPSAGRVPAPAQYAEIAVPGAAIGLVAGVFAAGVAALAGLPGVQIATIATGLGIPLALLGAGYCVLLATGRFGVGAVGPVALYWLVGFPLARLIDEVAVAGVLGHDDVLRDPLLSFLAFQALLSIGFAIGFLWLHERLAPHWYHRIQRHNTAAADLMRRYIGQAAAMEERRAAAGRGRRRGGS
ncbi:hypothetical protein ACFPZ0_25115 [Streptomonospora nanhaiensis]|uniref:Uncharacterized protein n=1 Tax=Streptomonospora nanhaiensis TaxID=1323731 RepID=A0A853BIP2_9ACTN|nr:hypothetical protein [Streptomonospora nanhaiensis]MBV2365070.1 hypothetical protein [Streptomonospora nanhaiensis]MBX9391151.1 hypothetical protein [Streptomonospora nanhaiensis]NYI94471.1 hypothetical protein [Streptomonospora nanhaiensis]